MKKAFEPAIPNILAIWLVLTYDLLGKRQIDDVIHTYLIFCGIEKDILMLPPGAVAPQEKVRI